MAQGKFLEIYQEDHTRLKIEAARRGLTMKDFFSKLLKDAILQQEV